MSFWANFTDYLRFPHIEHFESVPDLLYRLETTDPRGQSLAMRLRKLGGMEVLAAAVASAFASSNMGRMQRSTVEP